MQPLISGAAAKVSLENWERKPLYDLFRDISEPFHGVCWRVNCTETYRYAKALRLSVFLSLVHRALVAAHQVEQFTTRIVGDSVWKYEVIHGSSAVGRPNGTIGFGFYQYRPVLKEFAIEAAKQVERVKQRTDIERHTEQDLIRFSVLPWFDFTSISHARDFAWRDSVPRITFGKITEQDGRHTMPVSVHVHHALADGLHVARFAEYLERNLAIPDLGAVEETRRQKASDDGE